MPPKKSIFRQSGARHFQLVHRSQRDPLIHDPEASQHVLKSFERGNDKKGKSRADLEHLLSPSELAHDLKRANIGEAATYGIYYDDTEYDYMQHLKPVGVQEEGVESMLIEAPTTSKGKGKSRQPIELRDLPPEALPSTSELPRNYESQEAVQSSIAGFQPDMDPHLRQVLEALEDNAFVDDGLEDDFFGELVADGERAAEEDVEFEFDEDGLEEEVIEEVIEEGAEDEGWEARFARFKKEQKAAAAVAPPDSDVDELSEGGDTVGGLPEIKVIGGKRRRKGTSDASGFSMSSSSMYRNEHLAVLDERFDKIEKEYASDEDEEEDHAFSDDDNDSDEAPQLITTREDFESMMDEFLDQYEILGGKMKPILPGDSGAEKLDMLRRAMGQDDRVRIQEQGEDDEDEDEDEILRRFGGAEKEERWDCETILTTYSNLENHPRTIRAREPKPVPRIRLDRRTGLPVIEEKSQQRLHRISEDQSSDTPESEEEVKATRTTIARPRDESKEDKKARKQTAKAERQVRRAEKKATKEQFSSELKKQAKGLSGRGIAKTRKL